MSQFLLVRDADTGVAQLIDDGVTVWASDADPDVLEDIGTDALTDADMGDVLEYLVSCNYLTDAQADEIPVDSPEDDDDDFDDDDDGFDDDDDVLEPEELTA